MRLRTMKPELATNASSGWSMDDQPWREPADPPPLDLLDQPPVDRYCDVVLTGGVTDGVVYPWAVLELARKYHFKNIGGTSVGAMAAALTAAAEFGRRHGSVTGFNEVLRKLPRKLGEDVNGATRLFSLFQPAPSTRRLFELFVGLAEMNSGANEKSALRSFLLSPPALNKERLIGTFAYAVKTRIRRFVVALLRLRKKCRLCALALSLLALWASGAWKIARVAFHAYRGPALIGVLAALLIGIAAWRLRHFGSLRTPLAVDVLCSLAWDMVVAVVFVGLAVLRDLLDGFLENGFGLCTGHRTGTAPPEQQSLIEWLHEGIQGACGKPLDRPLTFKDLWDAPGGPIGLPLSPARQTRKSRSIDLRMVTTNLTHGRPYGLPVDDETSRLFFRKEDLARYFPKVVLDYLVDRSHPYVCKVPGVEPDPINVPKELLELPAAELPVVVAARLSLSFPVLFSAVPLWAIDYEPVPEQRRLRRCWFSDGGICSNFPIHMFDAALPRWPTFGIALGPRSLFWNKQAIFLPMHYNQGRADRWDRFGDKTLPVTNAGVSPWSRLSGFLLSIVWSAKDWNDKTSMRMPGVRDRVIRVNLKPGEGGLNLKLTRRQILKLAHDYGRPAGKALVKKFIGPATAHSPFKFWNEHRWVRFNSLLVGLRERIEAIGAAAELAGYTKPLSAQIAEAVQTPPLGENDIEGTLTSRQSNDLENLLAALKDLASKFAHAESRQPYTPLPTPSMRIRPPL